MKIDLEQNTPGWLEFRKTKVTASEISILMGTNPWSTVEDLIGIKCGMKVIPDNAAMKEGRDREQEVRAIVCRDLETIFSPAVYLSDENPLFMASLDGISPDEQEIIEIKVVGNRSWNNIVSNGIPIYYYQQMLWQMMCSGAKVGYFIAFHRNTRKIHMNPITMNSLEIEKMKDAAIDFLKQLEDFQLEMKRLQEESE